jgi:hypothetical protein
MPVVLERTADRKVLPRRISVSLFSSTPPQSRRAPDGAAPQLALFFAFVLLMASSSDGGTPSCPNRSIVYAGSASQASMTRLR